MKSQRMWKREQERRRQERLRRARRRRNCAIAVVFAVIIVMVIVLFKACSGNDVGTTTPALDTNNAAPVTEPPIEQTYTMNVQAVNTAFFDNSAFLGNSLVDSFNKYNLLPQVSFYASVSLNLDNVYTTVIDYGTISAADSLKSTKFNKIFLSFGERELELNNSQEFLEKYRNLVGKVKEYQPNAQIYVLSVPPSSKTASDSNLYGASVSVITEYNRQIEKMCEEYKLFYVDSVAALANSNRYLADGVSSDGINLNRDACITLLNYITVSAYVPDAQTRQRTTEAVIDTTVGVPPVPTAAPTAMSTPQVAENTPAPTVNVLKDSVSAD